MDEEQKKEDEEQLEEALAEEGIVMEMEPPPEPKHKSSKKRKHNKVAPGDNRSRRSKSKKKKDKGVVPVSSSASNARSRRKYLHIKHDPSWKVNTYKDLPDWKTSCNKKDYTALDKKKHGFTFISICIWARFPLRVCWIGLRCSCYLERFHK